jgi:hypothetical protein
MKRIILLVLVSFMLFIPAACGEKEVNETNNSTRVLMSFDDYWEVQSIVRTWGNLFGRAEINTDKQYVKEGTGSLHVQPAGDYNSENAYPFILIDCEKSYFGTSDFSNLDNISLDVFNDTDKDLTIMMHLSIYGFSGGIEDTPIKSFALKPKAWNKVIYDLSDGSLKKAFKNLENAAQIFLQFPEYKHSKTDEVNSLYIDNLNAKVNNKGKTFNAVRESNELLFFENIADINFINARGYEMNIIFNAELSININPAYVTQGNKSLKCYFKKIFIEMDSPFIFTPRFWIPLKINTSSFDQSLFSGAEGIAFDVFNACETNKTIKAFYVTNGKKTETSIVISSNSKQTIELKQSNTENVTEFGIMHYSDSEATYYIDNVRVIK